MLALSIAQSAFANYKGEKQKESLKYLKKALHECMCLDPDVEKKADRKISFRAYGDSTIDPDIFEVVSNALIYEKMLSINYQTLTKKSHGKNADTVPSITVTPLHMSCIDNQWYLFALPEKEKQVRVYSMVRISGVRVGDSCDDYPENFSVDDFLEKRFKIAHGDGKKEYDIKILFDQEVADFVMGKKWHPNEKMSLKEDGKVLYEITLSSLVEIESWLLSFRYHFQVLEPKELRTKVRKTAKRLLDNHM
jgi:predicted DNA-binding transcriptional regulator YafY